MCCRYYTITAEKGPWAECEPYCNSIGGHCTIFDDPPEYGDVFKIIGKE